MPSSRNPEGQQRQRWEARCGPHRRDRDWQTEPSSAGGWTAGAQSDGTGADREPPPGAQHQQPDSDGHERRFTPPRTWPASRPHRSGAAATGPGRVWRRPRSASRAVGATRPPRVGDSYLTCLTTVARSWPSTIAPTDDHCCSILFGPGGGDRDSGTLKLSACCGRAQPTFPDCVAASERTSRHTRRSTPCSSPSVSSLSRAGVHDQTSHDQHRLPRFLARGRYKPRTRPATT